MVHGAFGIGFPLVATSLLALFGDVLTAMLITLLPTMSVNLMIIYQSGLSQLRIIKKHLLIIPFALAGTMLGSILLVLLDPRPFLLLLSAAILLYLNQEKLKRLKLTWIGSHRLTAYVLFGLVAGLMAGTVNVMMPVLIILFLELKLAMASMVMLFNINFFSGKLTQSLFFSQQLPGVEPFLLKTLWLVPVALLALLLGSGIRERIDEAHYLKFMRALLWIIAVVLVARFFYSYIESG